MNQLEILLTMLMVVTKRTEDMSTEELKEELLKINKEVARLARRTGDIRLELNNRRFEEKK